jgi:hypothetical protein
MFGWPYDMISVLGPVTTRRRPAGAIYCRFYDWPTVIVLGTRTSSISGYMRD